MCCNRQALIRDEKVLMASWGIKQQSVVICLAESWSKVGSTLANKMLRLSMCAIANVNGLFASRSELASGE